MDTNHYKATLLKMRNDLLERINKLDHQESFGDDVDGFEEKADEAEELSTNEGIENSLKEHLELIEDALRKIEHGQYGICEICGRPIEEEVLMVDPESELCKICKKTN